MEIINKKRKFHILALITMIFISNNIWANDIKKNKKPWEIVGLLVDGVVEILSNGSSKKSDDDNKFTDYNVIVDGKVYYCNENGSNCEPAPSLIVEAYTYYSYNMPQKRYQDTTGTHGKYKVVVNNFSETYEIKLKINVEDYYNLDPNRYRNGLYVPIEPSILDFCWIGDKCNISVNVFLKIKNKQCIGTRSKHNSCISDEGIINKCITKYKQYFGNPISSCNYKNLTCHGTNGIIERIAVDKQNERVHYFYEKRWFEKSLSVCD